MKKFLWLLILIPALILPVAAAVKFPLISEGTYSANLVNISKDDFFAGELVFDSINVATLTDSKPEELTVASEIKSDKAKYGSFVMGNNDEKIWFTMAQDKDGYWADFYLDQNLDQKISASEKIKDLSLWDPSTSSGYKRLTAAITKVPITLMVSYKGANDKVIYKKVSVYLWAENYYKKGAEDYNEVSIETVSALEGLVKMTVGKEEKAVKYRIMDANCNGCFNDYGKDVIYTDQNFDGKFTKKEALKIVEFYDLTVEKKKKQVRFMLPAIPAKIAVADALTEFDLSTLEPASDK